MEIALRDEAQQLGTPDANCILAHIKQALDVMIGDHRQPGGGSRPNRHFVTELLENKACGLNAIPADLFTPSSLPQALRKQVQQSPAPWKKGRGPMPNWEGETGEVLRVTWQRPKPLSLLPWTQCSRSAIRALHRRNPSCKLQVAKLSSGTQ